MRIRLLAPNQTELYVGPYIILYSYETPVAAKRINTDGIRVYKSSTRYSTTSSRHVNKWVGEDKVETVKQSVIDAFARGE